MEYNNKIAHCLFLMNTCMCVCASNSAQKKIENWVHTACANIRQENMESIAGSFFCLHKKTLESLFLHCHRCYCAGNVPHETIIYSRFFRSNNINSIVRSLENFNFIMSSIMRWKEVEAFFLGLFWDAVASMCIIQIDCINAVSFSFSVMSRFFSLSLTRPLLVPL